MRRVDHRLRQSSRTRAKGDGQDARESNPTPRCRPCRDRRASSYLRSRVRAGDGVSARRGRCARQVEDRLHQPRSATKTRALRRERGRERAAEADGPCFGPYACVVARRAEDRLRKRAGGTAYHRRLRCERRRKRAAEAGAQRDALLPGRPTGGRSRSSSDSKIYLMNADGSEHRALTRLWNGRSRVSCMVARRAETRLPRRGASRRSSRGSRPPTTASTSMS